MASRSFLTSGRIAIGVALALAGVDARLFADAPRFRGLGDLPGGRVSSTATDISADGTTIVGYGTSDAGTEAFVWRAGAIRGLGDLPGGRAHSMATGVSGDGGVIVGQSDTEHGFRAFVFRDDAMQMVAGLPPDATTSAIAVSDDGATVLGEQRTADHRRPWIRRGDDIVDLGDVVPDARMVVTLALSGDGRVVAGAALSDRGSEAVLIVDGVARTIGNLVATRLLGEAAALNHDGTIAAGFSASPWGHEAFLWREWSRERTMTPLGGLAPDRELFSSAKDVSATGNIVVGHSVRLGATRGREQTAAFVWDQVNGLRSLRDVLADEHGLPMFGWRLLDAVAVSDDGFTIVGNGINPDGEREAWLAELPESTAIPGGLDPADRDPGAFLVHHTTEGSLRPAGVAIDRRGIISVVDSQLGVLHRRDLDADWAETWGRDDDLGLDRPSDLAIHDDETIFVVDAGHDRVVVLSPTGRRLDAWGVAGCDPGQLRGPMGIAVFDTRVYVADTGNDRIQVFDRSGRLLHVIGGPGGEPGRFRRPLGIAVDTHGHLYVADADNHRVQSFDAKGRLRAQWGGPGEFAGLFRRPTDVVVHDGIVHVVDSGNNRIQCFDADGRHRGGWGRTEFTPRKAEGRIRSPWSYAIAPDGEFAVIVEPRDGRFQIYDRLSAPRTTSRLATRSPAVESWHGPAIAAAGDVVAITRPAQDAVEIVIVDEVGLSLLVQGHTHGMSLATTIGGTGDRFGAFRNPVDVAIDSAATRLVVSDAGNRRLQVFRLERRRPEHAPVDRVDARFAKGFDCRSLPAACDALPGAVTIDATGRVLFVDRGNRTVVVLDRRLSLVRTIEGAPLDDPVDVAVDESTGRVLVLDRGARTVHAFDGDGHHDSTWRPTWFDHEMTLRGATSMTVGPEGRIYATDRALDAVLMTPPAGDTQRSVLTPRKGGFSEPTSIAWDGAGRLLVADWGNSRVVLMTPDGEPLGAFGDVLYTRSSR